MWRTPETFLAQRNFPTRLDADPALALRGIMGVVAETVADLRNNDEPVPEPIAERRFSGRFAVRVPPMIHRRLALEAAEEGISMNRLISAKLAL